MTDLVADGALEQLAGHVEQDVRLTTARQPQSKDRAEAAKNIAERFHGIKLSELTKGIRITPNFLLAMAFLAFTAWLFVVYWVRRHEPFANQVLGTPRAVAPTAKQDLMMMNNSRNALPIKTAPGHNGFYAPNLGIYDQNLQNQQMPATSGAQSFTQESINTQMPTGSWNPAAVGAHSLVIRGGREQIQVTNPEPIITSQPVLTPFHAPNQNLVGPQSLIGQSMQQGQGYNVAPPAQGGIYQMHVPRPEGARLKTVVNR